MGLRKIWVSLSCLIFAFGLTYGMVHFWGNLLVIAFYVGISAITGLGWLVKRSLIEKAGLPNTGIEIPLLFFLLFVSISLLLSSAPRIGLEKLAWYLFAALLFYFLIDQLEQNNPSYRLREVIFTVTLVVTASILLAALLETYVRYQGWWREVGFSAGLPPFQLRFTSLVGHPNTFMALVNMVSPVALMKFLRTNRRSMRVFSGFWLVMYGFAFPFSSSRGGWLGAVGWAGTLLLFWFLEGGRWKSFWVFLQRRLALTLAVGATLLVLGIYGAIRFYLVFAGSHPSHGAGLNLNREGIWASVLEAWQTSPWVGVGIGQLGFKLLEITKAFPTRFWPIHAHSSPLQVLGENGLFGFFAFFVLSVWALILFLRAYRASSVTERPWIAVSLAVLVGAVLHGIFEDFTSYPILLMPTMVHAAIMLAAAGPVARFKRLPLCLLAVPGLLVCVVALHYLWGYAPHYSIAREETINDWHQAAQASAESARRDPTMPFYLSQTGIAYAMAWQQSADPRDLANARNNLQQALAIEPNNSVYWADMAVLNWYGGEPDRAVDAIRQAIKLCPWDSSFYINYGWFLEQNGAREEALEQYQKALELQPSMVSHPFWMSNQFRRQVVALTPIEEASGSAFWEAARSDIAAEAFSAAQYHLALSKLFEEPPSAIALTRASLFLKRGEIAQAWQQLEAMTSSIEHATWGKGSGSYLYWYSRLGYPISIVPGYIRVTADYGQFENLQRLLDLQLSAGECEEAAFTWQVLQRELHAGELVPGGYPPQPACTPFPPDSLESGAFPD